VSDSPVEVRPEPTPEELAAVLAAHEALWPKPAVLVDDDPSPRWRFAGRWWAPRPRYGGWT
jgi:hypothetical protein